MFVQHLFADEWLDQIDQGRGINDPSWADAQQAILSLNAITKSIVTLADREWSDYFMLIAGSWDGRVVVNATRDNLNFFSLIDPAGSREMRSLSIIGENEQHEERKCVPVSWAIEAAQHFFETGELKSTLSWVRDA